MNEIRPPETYHDRLRRLRNRRFLACHFMGFFWSATLARWTDPVTSLCAVIAAAGATVAVLGISETIGAEIATHGGDW